MREPKQSLNGVKVLVAEDDPVIAMDYAAMLSAAGAEIVATSQTVADGVVHLQRQRVDAALVDFVLADGNSRTLQALLTEKRIPFVVISGYPSVLVRARKDQQVLHKPVTADNLCAAVRAICDPPG
jgi:two-component system, response regulator PdtaR